MTGTEKQIAWAEDIKISTFKAIEIREEYIREYLVKNAEKAAARAAAGKKARFYDSMKAELESLATIREALNSIDSAKVWIERIRDTAVMYKDPIDGKIEADVSGLLRLYAEDDED